MQKQQAMQRQQNLIQQQRAQAQSLQRQNSGPQNGRSPLTLTSPGLQRSPNMLNQIINSPQTRQPGAPVVLRKIIRPGPASVQLAQQQALLQQQQKAGQNKFIDLTDEEDATRTATNPVTGAPTKIHVKSPATLNSSVAAPNLTNGVNRGLHILNSGIASKAPIQRLPGNHFGEFCHKEQ